LRAKDCERINVDTTVQEKAIKFPTDSSLQHNAREKLVKACKPREIILRQTYSRLSKKSLIMQGRYSHARQMKRAKRERKSIRTYLGRVIRDIKRKVAAPDAELKALLDLAEQLYEQKRADKNKLYSLWAPEVECISKGKAHKKYEYGCKVAFATTCKNSWIVSVSAIHGNPYDGHTLEESVDIAEQCTGVRAKTAFVDKGYKGKEHHPEDVEVLMTGRRGLKGIKKKLLRARSAIEPVIGHMKNEHGLAKNQLHGKDGDKINAILSATAFNFRKILRMLRRESSDSKCLVAC